MGSSPVTHIVVSSSISNFREKLLRRTGLPEAGWFTRGHVCFFGLYHVADWVKFLLHRGKQTAFWCGSDILALERSLWRHVVSRVSSRHFCENGVEQERLRQMGIKAEIAPMIFDPPEGLKIAYKPSLTPHVYMTCHKGAEDAYGVNYVLGIAATLSEVTFHIYGIDGDSKGNVVYHGLVPSSQFDEEIKEFQAAIRLNRHDGFAETLAKSVLLGQWPISFISYPKIDFAPDAVKFVRLLRNLKKKTQPNFEGREFWINKLGSSLNTVLCRNE